MRVENFLRFRLTLKPQMIDFFTINVFHIKKEQCIGCTAKFMTVSEVIVSKKPLSDVDITRIYICIVASPHLREYFHFTDEQIEYIKYRVSIITRNWVTFTYHYFKALFHSSSHEHFVTTLFTLMFRMNRYLNYHEILSQLCLASTFFRNVNGSKLDQESRELTHDAQYDRILNSLDYDQRDRTS